MFSFQIWPLIQADDRAILTVASFESVSIPLNKMTKALARLRRLTLASTH